MSEIDLSKVTHELALQLNREALQKIVTLPQTPILLIERIEVEEVKAWLAQLGCSTFGKAISIADDEGRTEYAEWFINQIRKFYAYRAIHR